MNPLRYWTRLVITANPKKIPQTPKEALSILLANIIITLIVGSFILISNIIAASLPPDTKTFLQLFLFALMVFMTSSIIRRMFKVGKWRKKNNKLT